LNAKRIGRVRDGRLFGLAKVLCVPVAPRVVVVVAGFLCLLQFLIVPAFYDFNVPIRDLEFGFAEPTKAVIKAGTLWVCNSAIPGEKGCSFARRMPGIPYLYAGAEKIVGDSVLRIAVLKTAILDLLLLYFLFQFLSIFGADRCTLLIVAAVFAGPQFMQLAFSPPDEEGFLIQLLPVILIIQLVYAHRRENELSAWSGLSAYVAVNAAIYFIKSSMILIVVWNAVFVWLIEGRARVRAAATLAVFLPPLIWGAVVMYETGHFAVGSSIDGFNLLGGNNPVALDFYPHGTNDLEFGDGPVELDGKMVNRLRLSDLDPRLARGDRMNEWEYDAILRDSAIRWVIGHAGEELTLVARKLEVFFLDVRHWPNLPGYRTQPPVVFAAGIMWMVAMRIVLWGAIGAALAAVWMGGTRRVGGSTFLAFLACYSAPYIIGYAFERHVVPILLPAALFLVLAWRLNNQPTQPEPSS